MAKKKAIEAAVASYYVDFGDNPKSPIDLVENGLLKQQDILDHNGNHLVFTAEEGRLAELFMTKECNTCRKKVSSASSIGDTCPHCGVVWSKEGDEFSFSIPEIN